MDRYVPLSKKSKKEQKKFHAMQRSTWGGMNPVTRTAPNGKAYNRKKMKQIDIRNGSYFRNEDSCRCLIVVSIKYGRHNFKYFGVAALF